MRVSRFSGCYRISLAFFLTAAAFFTRVPSALPFDKAEIISDAKKTVVFLGVLDADGKPSFQATGFLAVADDYIHLITAKHAVTGRETGGEDRDEKLLVFFNNRDGNLGIRSIKVLKDRYGVDWIFHENPEVDVAAIPLSLEPEKEDFKVLPKESFIPSSALYETDDLFFLSYQPNIISGGRVEPIVRGGIVSLINEDGSFYIDASAFPGNSGSPVFLKPDLGRPEAGGNVLGGKFVGIVGEYVPYGEVAVSAVTGRPRVIFEENTGLSKVWSVNFIEDIIQSEAFRAQIRKLKSKSPASREAGAGAPEERSRA